MGLEDVTLFHPEPKLAAATRIGRARVRDTSEIMLRGGPFLRRVWPASYNAKDLCLACSPRMACSARLALCASFAWV